MTNVTYSVPSIHCPHCVHTIKMELSDLEGVTSVEGDVNTHKVTVEFSSPATTEKIEGLMAEINYPVAK